MARPPRTPRWLGAARSAGSRWKKGEHDWLSRALGRAGALFPHEVEAAIRAGKVKVDGRVVLEPLAPLLEGARVQIDGAAVDVTPRTRALLFHKPAGSVCSSYDPEGGPTVFEQLAAVLPEGLARFGWHAVGRLDRDTTGLLLFTNDERLVAHATAPATHLPKRYLAKVSGALTDAALEPLRQGLVLDDGPARPAKARIREPGLVELVLTEGRNHQVKRMLGAVGLPVLSLHREAIGELVCDVPWGQVRELSPDELRERLGFSPRGR